MSPFRGWGVSDDDGKVQLLERLTRGLKEEGLLESAAELVWLEIMAGGQVRRAKSPLVRQKNFGASQIDLPNTEVASHATKNRLRTFHPCPRPPTENHS
jgi:hypothetical protein